MRNITIMLLLLACVAQAQPNITKMEYWIGTDPGFGAAINIPVSNQGDINFIQTVIPNLQRGLNYIGYRSKDANNIWSHTNFLTLFVLDSAKNVITEVEYFWDTDNGFNTHADTVLVNPIVDISNGILNANVPINLSLGRHILFVRSKDSEGRWSHTNYVDSVEVTEFNTVAAFTKNSGINIYPNPFTDNITIQPNTNESLRVSIYDMEGKLVADRIIKPNTTNINTQTLAAGTYLICVWTGKNKIYRLKVVKSGGQ